MTEKKRQHHIPRIYLNAFCDPRRPADLVAGQPYEPALWVMDKSLSGRPKQRAPKKVLWATHTYTLKSDDPEHPVVEDQLSALETEYASVLPKVVSGEALTERDWIGLLVFIGALFYRTLTQMAFQQEQLDKLQHLYRQVERGATGTEDYSDEFWAGADEAGKRFAIEGAGGYARLIAAAGPWFLVNKSQFPFITSDTPVTHHFVHVDEIVAMGFPRDRWRPDARPSDRVFLSFCPLTPTTALVSSPSLLPPGGLPYWTTDSALLVGTLNLLTRERADKLIVSPVAQPFGPDQLRLLEFEAQTERETVDPRPILWIYTNRTRRNFRLESYEYHPGIFDSRLRFVTTDLDGLRVLAAAEWIEEATLYDADTEIGMRELVLMSVAISPDAPTELVQVLGRSPPPRSDWLPLDERARGG